MATVTNLRSQGMTAEDLIKESIEAARKDLRPISRRMLALMVVQQKEIPFRDASDIVDAYCEEHAPAIPGYVSSEFGLFWLKVVAVVLVAAGLFLAFQGVRAFRTGGLAWPWFIGTTVVFGLGVLSWVRSVEAEVKGG